MPRRKSSKRTRRRSRKRSSRRTKRRSRKRSSKRTKRRSRKRSSRRTRRRSKKRTQRGGGEKEEMYRIFETLRVARDNTELQELIRKYTTGEYKEAHDKAHTPVTAFMDLDQDVNTPLDK